MVNFTPASKSALSSHDSPGGDLILELDDYSVSIDRDRILIGSSPRCDIQLSEGPSLQCIIRNEEGVVWVEADDEFAELNVNWIACRRMSLRDGDVISVSGIDITIRQKQDDLNAASPIEQISSLSANELCDRIVSEQAAVNEFESGRQNGWRNLMAAVRQVALEDNAGADSSVTEVSEAGQRLLDQIRELTEMVQLRSQELDVCEGELVAASALLQQTQDHVSEQIEDLLNQIDRVVESADLRASA